MFTLVVVQVKPPAVVIVPVASTTSVVQLRLIEEAVPAVVLTVPGLLIVQVMPEPETVMPEQVPVEAVTEAPEPEVAKPVFARVGVTPFEIFISNWVL